MLRLRLHLKPEPEPASANATRVTLRLFSSWKPAGVNALRDTVPKTAEASESPITHLHYYCYWHELILLLSPTSFPCQLARIAEHGSPTSLQLKLVQISSQPCSHPFHPQVPHPRNFSDFLWSPGTWSVPPCKSRVIPVPLPGLEVASAPPSPQFEFRSSNTWVWDAITAGTSLDSRS